MSKFKRLIFIFIVIGIALIGFGTYVVSQKPLSEQPIQNLSLFPEQPLPEAGAHMLVSVVACHNDGTGVEGVEVAFTDTGTGEGSICITDQYGRSETSLVCQDTYSITATFNGSTLTANQVIECDELVGVLISEDDTIESIVFE